MGLSGNELSRPRSSRRLRPANEPEYDELGIEVKGKIVVMVRRCRAGAAKLARLRTNATRWRAWKEVALPSQQGGGGILSTTRRNRKGDTIPPFSYLATATASRIPCVQSNGRRSIRSFRRAWDVAQRHRESIDGDLKPLRGR